MKRVLTFLGCLVLAVAANAQLFVSTNTPLYISNGDIVAVSNGDVTLHTAITGAGTGQLVMNAAALQNLNTNGFEVHGLQVKNTKNVVLNGNVTIPGTLTLASGAFSVNGYLLILAGRGSSSSGTLLGSRQSRLTFASDTTGHLGTLDFSPGAGNIFARVTVNNPGAGYFMLGDTLQVTDSLVLTQGMLQSNGNLVLKSDSLGTASVSPVATGTIYGSVIVQRYIPGHRAWRFLTAPLTGATSIFANWQNGGTVTGNTGVELWSPAGTGSTGNGLLAGGGAPSIEMLDPISNNFIGLTNTNQVNLDSNLSSASNKAFGVFVTGPYGSARITAAQGDTSTTLMALGILQAGPQIFNYNNVPAANFILVGNPYASPVNFTQVGATGATSGNIANTMWAWDAQRQGTSYGGYVTFSWDAANNTYDQDVPTNQTAQTINIQSGQAIMVQAVTTGTATVTFNESDKASSNTNTSGVFGVVVPPSQLQVALNRSINNSMQPVDGALVKYGSIYSAGVSDDASKLYNYDENLALRIGSNYLAIERRPLPAIGDTLFLDIYGLKHSSSYSFSFTPANITLPEGAQPYLVDNFLNTKTPVSFAAANTETFSTTEVAGSYSESRFIIVLKSATALADTKTSLKGWQETKGVQVQWSTITETGIKDYMVEKSADAIHFTTSNAAAAVNDGNSHTYGWLDENPFNGNNYYRIRIVNSDGSINYSDVVLVKLGILAAFKAYPNPVHSSEQLNVELNGVAAGKYTLQLFGTNGVQIAQKAITSDGSTANVQIILPKLAAGVYQLVLLDDKGNSREQKVTVE